MTCYLLHSGQPSAQRLLARVSRLRPYVANNAIESDDIIIRFGTTKESDPVRGTLLNPAISVQRTKSRLVMARFLRRVGIRFALQNGGNTSDAPRFTRQYQIPLFDLQPLACFRADPDDVWRNQRIQKVQDSFREVGFNDEKVNARVLHLAMRALHALNLDYGLVSIGMTQKGLLHVLDVSATPVLQGRLADLYVRAIEDYLDREAVGRTQATTNVMLGTDVEVMLRNATGKMVLASKYFSRKGRVGCDDRSVQFDGKRLPLMELRPEPDANPLQVVHNLRDTMEEAARTINRTQVEWRAGSMPFRPYCTGGHIHLSQVPFSRRLVCTLDQYLGLPAMLVEDASTATMRRPRYGFLGDVRMKDHGGFEYRTPASFVVDPEVTTALLCLAYIIAVHYRELPTIDIYSPAKQLDFYKGRKDALYAAADRSMAELRRVAAYERYRDHIEPLFSMIQSRGTWDESVDVRRAWGIPIAQTASRRQARLASNRVRVFG